MRINLIKSFANLSKIMSLRKKMEENSEQFIAIYTEESTIHCQLMRMCYFLKEYQFRYIKINNFNMAVK